MRSIRTMLALAAIAASAQAAAAANDLILISNDELANSAVLNVEGNGNRLSIVQEHVGAGSGNSLSLTIEGDFNGGPLGSEFTGAAALPGLQPGSLVQKGHGNAMTFEVTGSHNLFAAAQLGNNNTVDAVISGSYNQASVMQVGHGNFAAFSQTGFGNTVSISQTSW